jgi:hypothetical protein
MAVRDLYLEAGNAVLELVSRDDVARAWDQPSALSELTVGALVGHLVRSILLVETILDRPQPDGPVITAIEYYAALQGIDDLHSELNVGVRERADEVAAAGRDAVVEQTAEALTKLRTRLATERETRLVEAFSGRALIIDEYLVTRLVEMVVHVDDLAVTLDISTPDLGLAQNVVIETLTAVARVRAGDLAVLRALTRRERDPGNVFPVF